MAPRYDTVSFLSDYGRQDEFVGVVHSVIRSIAPEAAVIDLTHDIAAHDVRAGALTLARSAPYLCPGVVLAVVDPGVGGDRRAVAVEVGDGESVLVGPDNGLLASAVALCGGATAVVELTNPDRQLAPPGPTFAGRDIFAPAAAHLCAGVPLDELGPAVDPAGLVPGMVPLPQFEGATLVCEVLWVDRFGNLQLNVGPDEVADLGERVRLRLVAGERVAVRAGTYGALAPDQLGLVVDSYGMVSIALNRASAADELRVGSGAEVRLEPMGAETGGSTPGTSSVLRLTSRERG